MENFEKNIDKKLRAESMVDDVAHNRNGELEDTTGNIFRVTQRIAEIRKDSKKSKKELKIAEKDKEIQNRNDIIEELKERKKEFEIFANDKNRLDESLRIIKEIDQMIVELETKNVTDGIKNKALINRLSTSKPKPEENIWKN